MANVYKHLAPLEPEHITWLRANAALWNMLEDATLKELRLAFADYKAVATPSELRNTSCALLNPGLPKPNPGLELANAFSVIRHPESPPCQSRKTGKTRS